MPKDYQDQDLSTRATLRRNSRLQVVRCPACSQQTYAGGREYCDWCGARLNVSSSVYSGSASADIITGASGFDVKPSANMVDKRRHPRIPCRGVKACIKTDHTADVVDVVNMSRAGLCFQSAEQFVPGTPAAVAIHYVEGGQNIFQNGRIIWAKHRSPDLPAQHGVEFSLG